MPLTQHDRNVIRKMREANILENVASHEINCDGKNVIVMCSDGHQSPDVIKKHTEFLLQPPETSECCCHPLMLNGGSLLLSASFVGAHYKHAIDELLLEQIDQSLDLKRANTVVLYTHAPCGVAYLHGLPFEDMLKHQFAGKKRVKEEFKRKRVNVACFVQVDDDQKKRTSFISRKKWEEWSESRF